MKKPGLLAAGNWKMHGLRGSLSEIAEIKEGLSNSSDIEAWIFPPATLIQTASALAAGSALKIGAQDCHWEASGAFTGDLSAPMLKDAGASAVILGHSERRSGHGETSETVRRKAAAALDAGLTALICVGETKGEREAGLAPAVCERQLSDSLPAGSTPENVIIAYEPVWAIGTGISPAPEDIARIHAQLRAALKKMYGEGRDLCWRILYGGSVTPMNAAAIFSCKETDGALVGGASLNAAAFLAIIAAASNALRERS